MFKISLICLNKFLSTTTKTNQVIICYIIFRLYKTFIL